MSTYSKNARLILRIEKLSLGMIDSGPSEVFKENPLIMPKLSEKGSSCCLIGPGYTIWTVPFGIDPD